MNNKFDIASFTLGLIAGVIISGFIFGMFAASQTAAEYKKQIIQHKLGHYATDLKTGRPFFVLQCDACAKRKQ